MKLCSSLMWRDCGLNLWKSKGSFVHGRLTVRAVSAESLQAAPAWTQLWLLLTVKYSNLCPGSHTSTANISADPAIILGNLLLEIWSIRYHSKYAEVEHLTSLWFLVTSAAETCWMLQGRAAPGRIYETIPQRLQHVVLNYGRCAGSICLRWGQRFIGAFLPFLELWVTPRLCFVPCSNSAFVMKRMWPNPKLSKPKTPACGDLSAETKMAATLTYGAASPMTTRGHSWPFRCQYGACSPSETHVLTAGRRTALDVHLHIWVCVHAYTHTHRESPEMNNYVMTGLVGKGSVIWFFHSLKRWTSSCGLCIFQYFRCGPFSYNDSDWLWRIWQLQQCIIQSTDFCVVTQI